MRRVLCLFTLVMAVGAVSASIHAADSKPPVTVESLLDRMVDFRWLATPPVPGERTIQFSSYDRATKLVDGKIVNPFANGDCNQYLRSETNNGVKEWVLADDDGPGYVSRIWSANPAGDLHIYIDGATTPTLAADFAKITNGEIAPFGHPYGHDASRGRNLYFPFPFAKHIKITTTKDGQYFQVSVAHLPAGTNVESYSTDILKRANSKIESIRTALMKPLTLPTTDVNDFDEVIAPGDTATYRQFDGPGMIAGVSLGPIEMADKDRDLALARSLVTITFDDAPAPQVAVPLGDFFGSGPGVNAFRTSLSQVTKNGSMIALWPMPFQKGFEIALTNGSDKPLPLSAAIALAPLPAGLEKPLYFHARWRQQDKLKTVAGNGTMDWPALRAAGSPGRFVGLEVNVFNPVTAWWGEGDEKIYVDGEKFPSTIGTGTEDYFGYAWCDPHFYTWPFHSESRCDGPGNRGNTSNVRYQILDSVPWQKALAFDIEVWHWAAVEMQYASIAYFYAAEGVKSDPGVPDLSKRVVYYAEDIPIYRKKGAIEAEKLKVKANTGGPVPNQDMAGFGEQWSNAEQLWWHPGKTGAVLTLELPVEKAGSYAVAAAFTKAIDYGIVQLAIDGKPLGLPVDLFHDGVIYSGSVDLGKTDLTAGTHDLTITITGKNPKATNVLVGMDWIELKPAK